MSNIFVQVSPVDVIALFDFYLKTKYNFNFGVKILRSKNLRSTRVLDIKVDKKMTCVIRSTKILANKVDTKVGHHLT